MQNKIIKNTVIKLACLLALAIVLSLPVLGADDSYRLCPGGNVFGVKLYTDGVIVTAVTKIECADKEMSPAADAGIKAKDIIITLNGEKLKSSAVFKEAVTNSNGTPLKLEIKRGSQTLTCELCPTLDKEGNYKVGLCLCDSTAGVGTITFVDPESGAFAGLGHGICDSTSGELLPMSRGIVNSVNVCGIKKGAPGAPGEIHGSFHGGKIGKLLGNTNVGVYGVINDIERYKSEPLKLMPKEELKAGKAYILSTLDSNGVGKYEIEISDIDTSSKNGRCFSIKVTDPRLIEKTGGIVQGMSGSPIIQDNKLAGAVTHVLIGEPKCGYGIFIENMLASTPEILK